ncbi:WD40/YVTN/BNR-like repeat-containing protein, partial [Cysteiniphilum sp. 19S12-1]|uniref:WD40/YVTN/BNR-like repeat-containing protein n=3 Tax=Cysteiniphilum TaxID=2056696 RepID=UPI003F866199
NNADQVNQLMLGSSSSSQLQMSDSYHLLISGGESIEIPLKARNNSSLSLNNLATSILPNDGSLVTAADNDCGATLLGQSYCNNSYHYTAPNLTKHEEKLYSLAYGDTKNNGNNSAGVMLGVDIFPKFIDLALANNTYIASNSQQSFYLKDGIVYAATRDGLSISSSGGKSWRTYGEDKLGVSMINSTYVDAGTIYVGTNGAGLAISKDGGVTWHNIKTTDGIINDYVNSVYVNGKEIILGTDGGLSISNDGGLTWTNIDQSKGVGGNKIGSIYIDNGTIYAGDYRDGGLSISNDNGATWQVIKKAANGLADNAVESISKHNGKIYVGTDNGLSITSDGGKTWDNKAIGKEFNAGYSYASGLCFLDNKIYAPIYDPSDTTWHGGLEFSADEGGSWQRVSAIETMNVSALSCDESNIYVGDGNQGGMWISHDKGATFERQYNPLDSWAMRKFFSANHKLYGLTSFGQTSGWAISDDNGANWTTYIAPHGQGSPLPFNMQINDMYVNGTYMYIASPVGIYISNDSGSAWQRVNDSKLHGWIAAIAGSDDGKYLYAVTDDYGNEGVYISLDHGVTWTRTYNGVMDGYAEIYVVDDKFYTWTQQGGGFTGALLVFNEDGSYDKQFLTGKAIESVYLKNNELYVGTRENGLYVTSDGGAHWSNMTSGVTELDGYSITAIYTNRSAIYIGLDAMSASSPTYGAAISYDNGITWQRYFEYDSCNSIAASNNGNIFITCSFGSHAVGEILVSN